MVLETLLSGAIGVIIGSLIGVFLSARLHRSDKIKNEIYAPIQKELRKLIAVIERCDDTTSCLIKWKGDTGEEWYGSEWARLEGHYPYLLLPKYIKNNLENFYKNYLPKYEGLLKRTGEIVKINLERIFKELGLAESVTIKLHPRKIYSETPLNLLLWNGLVTAVLNRNRNYVSMFDYIKPEEVFGHGIKPKSKFKSYEEFFNFLTESCNKLPEVISLRKSRNKTLKYALDLKNDLEKKIKKIFI